MAETFLTKWRAFSSEQNWHLEASAKGRGK